MTAHPWGWIVTFDIMPVCACSFECIYFFSPVDLLALGFSIYKLREERYPFRSMDPLTLVAPLLSDVLFILLLLELVLGTNSH